MREVYYCDCACEGCEDHCSDGGRDVDSSRSTGDSAAAELRSLLEKLADRGVSDHEYRRLCGVVGMPVPAGTLRRDQSDERRALQAAAHLAEAARGAGRMIAPDEIWREVLSHVTYGGPRSEGT